MRHDDQLTRSVGGDAHGDDAPVGRAAGSLSPSVPDNAVTSPVIRSTCTSDVVVPCATATSDEPSAVNVASVNPVVFGRSRTESGACTEATRNTVSVSSAVAPCV